LRRSEGVAESAETLLDFVPLAEEQAIEERPGSISYRIAGEEDAKRQNGQSEG
jgi:hypothetical protein